MQKNSNDDFNRFLEELKYKCDIVSIVSQYVPLTKKSGKYFGCCPFHNEKTASFCVNSDGQYYHCFGCGVSGNVINFIMEMESLSFIDAVKYLADKAGMTLPEYKADPHHAEKKEHKEVLKQIMRDAARFYRNNLLKEREGKDARGYLENRGINAETSKKYGLGLSLDYDSLQGYMRRKGYSVSDLEECGLIVGEQHADAFGNRIIVPIFNAMNEVVAFGGRVYHGEKDAAKYKNSTNTTLFDKSGTVYGVNFIKKERQHGNGFNDIILVEGYMDVISLGAAGINNAVAGMGTALTPRQAKEIKNITKQTLYVCYDGDSAGQKASIKNVEPLLAAGADVRVVSLEDGLDPDETVRQKGYDGFQKFIAEALPVIDYKLKLCMKAYDLNSVNGRAGYVAVALKVLKTVESAAEREVYLQTVSKFSRVSVATLADELALIELEQKADSYAERAEKGVQNTDERAAKAVRAARFILNRLLDNANYARTEQINENWLVDTAHKKAFEFITKSQGKVVAGNLFEALYDTGISGYTGNRTAKTDIESEKQPEIQRGTDVQNAEVKTDDEKSASSAEQGESSENADEINKILDISLHFDNKMREAEYYFDCLNTIANEYISRRLDELKQKFGSLTDADEKRACIAEIGELNKKLKSKNIIDKL